MANQPGPTYAVGVHLVQNIPDYIEENLLEPLTPARTKVEDYLMRRSL